MSCIFNMWRAESFDQYFLFLLHSLLLLCQFISCIMMYNLVVPNSLAFNISLTKTDLLSVISY